MRRAIAVEFRRGAGLALVPTLALTVAVALFFEPQAWAGRWVALSVSVRQALLVVAPVAAAAAAWQGSRERRRRIEELPATARPAWQRVVASWAGVTAGACLGLALGCAPAIAAVARVATYDGGLWWALLTTGVLVLVACSAAGFAVGSFVPGRAVAPLVGFLVFLALLNAGLLGTDVGERPDGGYVPLTTQALQTGWFASVAVGSLALAGARRRWLAGFAGATALACAAPLAMAEPAEMWRTDPAAVRDRCSGEEPRVCVTQETAFALDELVSSADDALSRVQEIPGAANATVETDSSWPGGVGGSGEPVPLPMFLRWSGSVAPMAGNTHLSGSILRAAIPSARSHGCEHTAPSDDLVHQAVLQWAGDPSPPWDTAVVPMAGRLEALAAGEQQAFVSRYLRAVESCDAGALRNLAEELR